MSSDSNRNYRKPKHNILSTTNASTSRPKNRRSAAVKHTPEPLCSLLAKDSEWVDILQIDSIDTSKVKVNCEDEPEVKPLAIMFPGLLNEDPHTLQGMLNRAMSTTEVTRHLVDLGQKANFKFMKKADRLIPPDKQWMETLTENSNSHCSLNSAALRNCLSNDYDADSEITVDLPEKRVKKRKFNTGSVNQPPKQSRS